MSFEKEGIPDEFRTLVVIPMLFLNRRTIRDELYKLEVRYFVRNRICSSPSSAICPTRRRSGSRPDAALLRQAEEGIAALDKPSPNPGRFYLLYREREWVETERRFIGWERKRRPDEPALAPRAAPRPAAAGESSTRAIRRSSPTSAT